MAAKTLSIEVNDQIIKVCRVVQKGRGVRVLNSFMFRTPDDCVSDGVIANPQVLGRELKLQLTQHGLHNMKDVVFALSSSKIAIREVKLPLMKEKLLAKAIQTNADEYFPVDLKNYHITYSVLDTFSGPNAFMRVMVLATPIYILEGYFELAEITGLTVKAIDSCGNSQYQALRSKGGAGVTIYVDVNSASSLVSFIRDDTLLLQRTFAFGADELISHYMSASGKGNDGYISALRETDVTSADFAVSTILSQNDIQEDLSRLVGGIVRSVDFFNSSQWGVAASRVVLLGSNRHIVGLRDLVAEATGLETLYLDDVPEFIEFTSGSTDAATYISCIGSTIAPLDLIPQILKPSRNHIVDNKDSSILPGLLICCLFIFAGLGFAIFSIFSYQKTVNKLESMKEEISSIEYTRQVYETYISYQKGEEAVNTVAAEADTPNSKLVSFYEELEKKMPSSILILSAACTNEGVAMNITVANYTDAASVISELRSFKSISNIDVSDISSSENEAGIERIMLTVTCTYGENPYLNGVNPYSELVLPSETPAADASAATPAGEAAVNPAPAETQTQESGGAGQ